MIYWFDPEMKRMRAAIDAALDKVNAQLGAERVFLASNLYTDTANLVSGEEVESVVTETLKFLIECATCKNLSPQSQQTLIDDCVQAVLTCQSEYGKPATATATV